MKTRITLIIVVALLSGCANLTLDRLPENTGRSPSRNDPMHTTFDINLNQSQQKPAEARN